VQVLSSIECLGTTVVVSFPGYADDADADDADDDLPQDEHVHYSHVVEDDKNGTLTTRVVVVPSSDSRDFPDDEEDTDGRGGYFDSHLRSSQGYYSCENLRHHFHDFRERRHGHQMDAWTGLSCLGMPSLRAMQPLESDLDL
jgi:hypothetical protein